jgi:hypothetical protein
VILPKVLKQEYRVRKRSSSSSLKVEVGKRSLLKLVNFLKVRRLKPTTW